MSVKEGSLVAVVGHVGSGKSSLISAILGDLCKKEGTVHIKGSMAYVPQQAWILNATLEKNVTFGKDKKESKYERLIDACALKSDLKILPGGDQTEIGDKGINLSGGQKQRVSLARAVYQNSDIYILDDPLSAVDAHVGKHIFERVISNDGLLGGKTRILVTHGVSYLPKVDNIIVLLDGTISEMGTYKELMDHNGAFAEFLKTYLQEEDEEDEDDIEAQEFKKELRRQISAVSGDEGSGWDSEGNLSADEVAARRKRRHSRRLSSGKSIEADIDKLKKDIEKQTLTTEETAQTGEVKRAIYWEYIKANGSWVFLCMILAYACFIAASIGNNIWLSEWSNDSPEAARNNKDLRVGIYGVLGVAQGIFVFLQAICVAIGTISASRLLHHRLVGRIMRAPTSFFDTTPLGRIVNRVSKDIDTVDVLIPMTLRIWMLTAAQVLATIIIISYTTVVFLVALVPLGLLYYFAQKFYIGTSRQLKRIDSIRRSPIYSHFGTSVVGASSIRCYKQQERFTDMSDKLVDEGNMAYYANIMSNRWLGIVLELIGNLIILLAAVFAVSFRDQTNAGLVGLSVSYALQVTGSLNYMVRTSCDMETYIVSVERIHEYTNLVIEAAWERPIYRPPNNWPDKGAVQFKNYSVRYRDGLDLVLTNINCNINTGEKVGIVGRTGAGKSSLTLALFRLIEAAAGSIVIDDHEIGKLGLHDLRKQLTIIPQDPVLFSGDIRSNLDPFNYHSDTEIWSALELSHLKAFVSSLNERLQYEVAENGDNLSVGQRQLVCLARALLRRTKILILDEATAAVDMETDDLIQNTIRVEFKGCTVLTIAHRLNTIMDYDRVIVLDRGQIKEFDTPSNLLKEKRSIFYGMARDAGLV